RARSLRAVQLIAWVDASRRVVGRRRGPQEDEKTGRSDLAAAPLRRSSERSGSLKFFPSSRLPVIVPSTRSKSSVVILVPPMAFSAVIAFALASAIGASDGTALEALERLGHHEPHLLATGPISIFRAESSFGGEIIAVRSNAPGADPTV